MGKWREEDKMEMQKESIIEEKIRTRKKEKEETLARYFKPVEANGKSIMTRFANL